MTKNLSVEVAARHMGVNPQFIRIGLQQGVLKFGYAVRIGGGRYTYYISPIKFCEFTGISLDEIDSFDAFSVSEAKKWITAKA